uniref:Malate dehydrogenase n=1 Tax=Zeugodacus cucurbitae TaxID=28588 RepID=A0A0A1WVI2_ZEUCU
MMYHLTLDEAILKNMCDYGTTTYRSDYQPYELPRHKIDPFMLKDRENMYKRCAFIDPVPNKKIDPHGQCEASALPAWLRPNSKNIAECCEKIRPLHITAEQHRGLKENAIAKCDQLKELKLNRFYGNSMATTYPELYRSLTGKHVCDDIRRISSLKCYI